MSILLLDDGHGRDSSLGLSQDIRSYASEFNGAQSRGAAARQKAGVNCASCAWEERGSFRLRVVSGCRNGLWAGILVGAPPHLRVLRCKSRGKKDLRGILYGAKTRVQN
jgi:hypothetical protein